MWFDSTPGHMTQNDKPRAVFTDRHDVHPTEPTWCQLCGRSGQTVTVVSGVAGASQGALIRFDDGFESWAAGAELEVIA